MLIKFTIWHNSWQFLEKLCSLIGSEAKIKNQRCIHAATAFGCVVVNQMEQGMRFVRVFGIINLYYSLLIRIDFFLFSAMLIISSHYFFPSFLFRCLSRLSS